MPSFGARSIIRKRECHPLLQHILDEVIKEIDFTILVGYRNREAQNRAYVDGRSKLKWPNSKHNAKPSIAVDVAPWPIDWDDVDRFFELAEAFKKKADELGIDIRWGGDWDGDGDYTDQTFNDYCHFELVL